MSTRCFPNRPVFDPTLTLTLTELEVGDVGGSDDICSLRYQLDRAQAHLPANTASDGFGTAPALLPSYEENVFQQSHHPHPHPNPRMMLLKDEYSTSSSNAR